MGLGVCELKLGSTGTPLSCVCPSKGLKVSVQTLFVISLFSFIVMKQNEVKSTRRDRS